MQSMCSSSAGNKNDAPEGRKLIDRIYSGDKHYLLADLAYEDNETRKLSKQHGFKLIVPPKKSRKNNENMIKNCVFQYFSRSISFYVPSVLDVC